MTVYTGCMGAVPEEGVRAVSRGQGVKTAAFDIPIYRIKEQKYVLCGVNTVSR